MIRITNPGYVLENGQKIKLTPENVAEYSASQKYLTIKKENGQELNFTYEKLASELCIEFEFAKSVFGGSKAIEAIKNRQFIFYNNKREVFQPDFALSLYKTLPESILSYRELTIRSEKYGVISIKMGASPLLDLSDALILGDDYLSNRPVVNNKDLQRFFTYLIYNN